MKRVPTFKTDEQAEAFLEQDLSDLDFKQFQPVRFEFQPKSAVLNLRLPAELLASIKRRAKEQGIPYTRYVRLLLERDAAAQR